jgi:hypothetical protein
MLPHVTHESGYNLFYPSGMSINVTDTIDNLINGSFCHIVQMNASKEMKIFSLLRSLTRANRTT